MAIEGYTATVPLSLGQRLEGLNHIAELRAKVFGTNIEHELERFIHDMRDPRYINHKQNERSLAAIFFMAKFSAERHSVNINELTTERIGNSWEITPDRASNLSLSTRARARRPVISPNTSARTSTDAGWQKRSAKKPANHCATVPSTSVPGHHFTASSSSVSSAFQGVRHTASCVFWPGRPRERRAIKKPVRRCWKMSVWMPCWPQQMQAALPPTS